MQATTFNDLAAQIEVADDSTISRTLHQDDHVKVILFGFAAGQELSEHTASMAAILQIIQGQARITLGEEVIDAGPNAWVHMPPGLPHSIVAKTRLVMLLTMLKSAK